LVDVEHLVDDLARAAGIPEAEREKFCRGVARGFERAAASDSLIKIKSAPEAITVRELAERLAIALKALPAATKTNVDHFLETTRPGKELQIVDGRAVRAFTVGDLIRILEWINTVASGSLSAHRGNEPRKGGCPRGAATKIKPTKSLFKLS
jgi:hypothetical protein